MITLRLSKLESFGAFLEKKRRLAWLEMMLPGVCLRWLGGRDLDAGGFFGAGMGAGADDDFEVAAEASEEVHEVLGGRDSSQSTVKS